MSIQDCFTSNSKKQVADNLGNLLSREFGLKELADVENFVVNVLPTFELVRARVCIGMK